MPNTTASSTRTVSNDPSMTVIFKMKIRAVRGRLPLTNTMVAGITRSGGRVDVKEIIFVWTCDDSITEHGRTLQRMAAQLYAQVY